MTFVKHEVMSVKHIGRYMFKKTLNVGLTDTIEFDHPRKEVRLVNLHGKIKDKTTYTYRETVDGTQTDTGAGQDTRGLGEGSSEGDSEQVPVG